MGEAAIIGGATLGSALIGKSAADKAVKAQTSAADRAAQLQAEQYQQTREELQPYIDAGVDALGRTVEFTGGLGPRAQQEAFQQYVESPEVEFFREEGLRGIDRDASRRGTLGSGSREKARIRFADQLAKQAYAQHFNRVANLRNLGYQAAAAAGGAGATTAAQQAQSLQRGAEAEAAGRLTEGALLQGALSGLGSIYNLAQKGYFDPTNPPTARRFNPVGGREPMVDFSESLTPISAADYMPIATPDFSPMPLSKPGFSSSDARSFISPYSVFTAGL